MIWPPYIILWSKRSLSRGGLLDHFSVWLEVSEALFWVIVGYLGRVGVSRALFWVGGVSGGGWSVILGGGGGWENILGGLGGFGVGGGCVGWVGICALFDNAQKQ